MTTVSTDFKYVTKRDGRKVDFDDSRILSAVSKAMLSTTEIDNIPVEAERVQDRVIEVLRQKRLWAPTIEEIQDVVEEVLILEEFPQTAKHFILYRNKRALERQEERQIPLHVKELVKKSKPSFPNPLSEFVFYRTYSRWVEDESRRETWIESVNRYVEYMRSNLGDKLTKEEYLEIHLYIKNMWAMPSMRLFWAAGSAADFDNACCYNCSYVAISELRDFSELLYLLMCGCGVGFSVEAHTIQKLPIIKKQDVDAKLDYYVVGDSKQGWADALLHGLTTWFSGKDSEFDFSLLRPAGARLKTMGGRSSGPDPLIDLINFTRTRVLAKQGKRLSSIDVHDIICKIGEIVVSGGVRRSSLISLSDLDDVEMRDAKKGHFFLSANYRQLSNNSVAYDSKPTDIEFMREWLALAESGSGERGIFNRGSLAQQIPSRRLKTIEDGIDTVGTNPCGEITLLSKQFCNLTEVVAREEDTLKTLKSKIRIAAILGTYQSMLTNFPYLSKEWKENCEKERLLGVSVTGQWDSPAFRQINVERWAKAIAVDTNKEYAARFGINSSVSVTCVKPSGTVSQLVNAASGMHPRFAKYYIRRIRISATDPLFQMMKDQKYPYLPETGQSMETANTYVLDFPVEAPAHAITRHDLSALDQLEYWEQVKTHFTEHNPSQTIYVNNGEWMEVGKWVFNHWDLIGGLSFLPKEDNVYRLTPFEEITKEQYEEMVDRLPEIDYSQIMVYEKEDQTEGSKEYACVGDSCEI